MHKLRAPQNVRDFARLTTGDLPYISNATDGSVYMRDRNRYKHLYGNIKRIAQIQDPNLGLTENQKKRLPEDKSFLCNSKGKLTTKFKPKALPRAENP